MAYILNLTHQHRTAQLEEADRKWRAKESRNGGTYRDLLMPVQSRDVGHITRPALHEYLWTGTKTAIENYVAATVRGLRNVRKSDATGPRLDDKNEWFKARRMVLGRTALFMQGGSVFGLSHLGVMKALFEVWRDPRNRRTWTLMFGPEQATARCHCRHSSRSFDGGIGRHAH